MSWLHRAATLLAAAGLLLTAALPASAAPGPNSPGKGAEHEHFASHPLRVMPQAVNTAPTGLSPAAIQKAYSFPTSAAAGAGKTIAIVDAYNDPTIASDLAAFTAQYGLPGCTTANVCFTKVNQTGGTKYPKSDSGWSLEIALDVEWAHAVAPGAKILLVEANSASFTDLMAAEDNASAHAQYVSNSWGAAEFSGEASSDTHFARPGVSFFASAGDQGAPATYPSSSPNVISVGGTKLNLDSTGAVASETGWASSGGGCSAYETAGPAQAAFGQYTQLNCAGKRATPDVPLDADPASGVSLYDSTSYNGRTGWFTVGGTSASSPMWAARAADTGALVNASYVYGSSVAFRDILIGNKGNPCLTGEDLVTGRGSWDG
ncbi:S53 family peptidase [Arthrobacter liuii]|nr:S53 family peptidase [Arthrobacter liuii]